MAMPSSSDETMIGYYPRMTLRIAANIADCMDDFGQISAGFGTSDETRESGLVALLLGITLPTQRTNAGNDQPIKRRDYESL